MSFTSHRIRKSCCTNCDKELDGASSGENPGPDPDDITVCIYCDHVMAFDHQLKLRDLTEDEIAMVAGDPRIIEYQKMAAEFRKSKEQKGKLN